MRPLRLVFPAAIAAFLAIALCAASASAVTLCKENQKKCPAGMGYAKGTVFVLKLATGSETTFASKNFSARCLGSTVESKTNEESGSPLLGTISAFSLGVGTPLKCEGCQEIFARALPYNTELQEVTGVWTLTAKNGGSGIPGFRLTKCPPGGTEECVYGSVLAPYSLAFTGGKPATLAAKQMSLDRLAGSVVNCGANVEWTVTYEITEATEPGQKGVATPPVWASAMP